MSTAAELLAVARGELGVCESPGGSNCVKYNTWYYGHAVSGGEYPWCMAFIQWVFHRAGVALPRLTASCGELMRAAQAAGCWVTAGYRPGDVAIYDFPGGKDTDHCGIVESVRGDSVTAIEGNTGAGNDANGGQVQRRVRPLCQVVGAVRPEFTEEKERDDMDKETFRALWMEMRRDLQDNEAGSWSEDARRWAVATGLVRGGSAGSDGQPSYMWEDVMTREQLVTVLYRFAQRAGLA